MAQDIILSKEKMSSLEVAELTGKQHAHIMRDIKNLLKQGVSESNFGLASYNDEQGKERPCYELTKKGSLILASGYNAVLREKIIDRWEALETGQATPMCNQPQLPSYQISDPIERAEQWIKEEKERQALLLTNKQQKETIEKLEEMTAYTRMVLKSSSTILVTQIAQDYGMNAVKFNATLRDMNIQRKVGKQWILRSKFLDKGYVQSETKDITHKDDTPDVVLTTKWTQKGRLFLYRELKKTGILPVIEQNILFQEGGRHEN